MRTIEIAGPRSKLQRILLICLGTSLVLGGMIGLFLPIVPGVLLLVGGAVLLSRECPPLQRALEKCPASFPFVQQCLPKLHTPWRRRFPGEVHDSARAVRFLNASTPQPEKLQVSGLRYEQKRNSEGAEAACAAVKILVFDQNLEDLTWHAQPFEARGFEVYKCTSIEAALRCIEREELEFALVDQVSTAFEGLRVIRHLVRYNLHTPFIVLARQQNVLCYQQALSLGALDYLQKPVPVAEVKWMIDRYFGTRREQKGGEEPRSVNSAEPR